MMWYLLALIIWRCLYYLWNNIVKEQSKKLRNNLNIIVAISLVVLGLFVGLFCQIGKVFALSRIIVFAPFFWLGTIAQEYDFISFCKKIPRWTAALTLVATLGFIVWLTPQGWLDVRETVRCVKCYDMIGGAVIGLLGRTAYYVLAIVISIALTTLVIENKIISHIGKDSLKYYLFHGVILMFMSFFNVPWTWWLSISYFVVIMTSIYLINKTKLSDLAIRPVHFLKGVIINKKLNNNGKSSYYFNR